MFRYGSVNREIAKKPALPSSGPGGISVICNFPECEYTSRIVRCLLNFSELYKMKTHANRSPHKVATYAGRHEQVGVAKKPNRVDVYPAKGSRARKHVGHAGAGSHGVQKKPLAHRSSHVFSLNPLSWLKSAPGDLERKKVFATFLQHAQEAPVEKTLEEWKQILQKPENIAYIHTLQSKGLLGKLLDRLDIRIALGLVEQDNSFSEFIMGERINTDLGWVSWFFSLVNHFSPLQSTTPGGYVFKRMERLGKSGDVVIFEQEISNVMRHVTAHHMKGMFGPMISEVMHEEARMAFAHDDEGVRRLTSSVAAVLSQAQHDNRNVIEAVSQIINKQLSGLGDLWRKAYLDVYKKGATLGLEDWWLAARLAGECMEVEPQVHLLMDELEVSSLTRESKMLIHEILSKCTDSSFALRGAHYVFDQDGGKSYEVMQATFRDEAFIRGHMFISGIMKGHKFGSALRSRMLGSSHYADQKNDKRLQPQMGIDIPGVGHLLFGQRIKKDAAGVECVESWMQFEAHGASDIIDYTKHGLDFFRHIYKRHAQVGPLGYCRHSEKTGTELSTKGNLVMPGA